MAEHKFNGERKCPKCSATFDSATLHPEYDPVLVFDCPKCGQMLWHPGSAEDSDLFPYDPNADAGGF